jgi:hypothetical protein
LDSHLNTSLSRLLPKLINPDFLCRRRDASFHRNIWAISLGCRVLANSIKVYPILRPRNCFDTTSVIQTSVPDCLIKRYATRSLPILAIKISTLAGLKNMKSSCLSIDITSAFPVRNRRFSLRSDLRNKKSRIPLAGKTVVWIFKGERYGKEER